MNVSKELLEKAKTAKTAEELLEMAKAENIELTEEQAAKAFAELNKIGELSDEELDNVAGGCGRRTKFLVGDRVSHMRRDGKAVYGTVLHILAGLKTAYRVLDDGETCPQNYYESELTLVVGGGIEPEIFKSIQ